MVGAVIISQSLRRIMSRYCKDIQGLQARSMFDLEEHCLPGEQPLQPESHPTHSEAVNPDS